MHYCYLKRKGKRGYAHTLGTQMTGLSLWVCVCVCANGLCKYLCPYEFQCKLTQEKTIQHVNIPHDAITGSSWCLAIDLMLPEHLPKKHPNNFPVTRCFHHLWNYKREKFKQTNEKITLATSRYQFLTSTIMQHD